MKSFFSTSSIIRLFVIYFCIGASDSAMWPNFFKARRRDAFRSRIGGGGGGGELKIAASGK